MLYNTIQINKPPKWKSMKKQTRRIFRTVYLRVYRAVACQGLFQKKEAALLTSIEKDIQTHCKKLKIKQPPGFTEVDLVCNRGGVDRWILHEETSAVCPKHRYSLGIYYRPPVTCKHPRHENIVKKSKSLK